MYKKYILILIIFIIIIIVINSSNNHISESNKAFNPFFNYHNLLELLELLKENNTNTLINYNIRIPTYLKPRDGIPVANKYYIIKEYNDYSDFSIILYWINENEFSVTIRRLDNYKLLYPFKLKIYDIQNENFEIIEFEPTIGNELVKDIKTNIKLVKTNLDYKQLIPKIIIQTAKSSECNLAQYNSVMTFIELNPEYEYMFFDDNACYNYIKDNYDQTILEAYENLVPTAYKADLFRACILYKIGGCYFDIKQINKVPLREIIDNNEEILLCEDAKPFAFYNAVMLCVPNNITIKKVINEIVLNTINKYYGTCALCPTGPCLLYKIIPTHKTHLKNRFNLMYCLSYKIRHKGHIYSKKLDKIIIYTAYRGYYKKEDKNYYSILWSDRIIYK